MKSSPHENLSKKNHASGHREAEKNKNKIKPHKIKSSCRIAQRSNNTLHYRIWRTRPGTINWNQSALPHSNNKSDLQLWEKERIKEEEKYEKKNLERKKIHGWEIYRKKKKKRREIKQKLTEKWMKN